MSTKMSDSEFERQYSAATRRGEERLRNQPLATSVRYDATCGVIIQLNNDCRVCVPLSLLPELRGASTKDLRRVEIMGVGQAIEWPTLDQQFDVQHLLADAVGAKSQVLVPEQPQRSRPGKAKSTVNTSRTVAIKGCRPKKRKTAAVR